MNSQQTLNLRIIAPKGMIFTDQVLSISSTNTAGKFDILPSHANFITLIKNQPIVVRIDKKDNQTFNFPLAIIYTRNNQVNIYTDILTTA